MLSLALSLALLELSFSVFIIFPKLTRALPENVKNHFDYLYLSRVHYSVTMMPECAQYDSETFYTLKKGAKCRFSNREFSTSYSINSAGLRDSEDDLEKPEVIVLGDSFAMGWGVEQNETFSSVLQTVTNKKILNAGIASFGTEREKRMLRRLDLSHLRTIIIQYCENDAAENKEAVKSKGITIKSQNDYERLSSKHSRNRRYFPFKHTYYTLKNLKHKPESWEQSMPAEEESGYFLPLLEQIRAMAPQARILIFELNGRGRARSGFLRAVQQKVGGEPLVSVIEMETSFPENFYFDLDLHLKADGHQAVAKALAPYLEK